MNRNSVKGFTLLELLIVLAIMIILCLISFSGLQNILVRTHLDSDAYQFFLSLSFARQAAIKHNRLVTVCPTSNQITCSQDWSNGYMVVYDQNVLRTQNWHSSTTVVGNQTPIIQFTGDGRSLQRATFVIQNHGGFKIVIYDSGRIRLISA